ncbi:globin [Roseibacillus ishigakijimensis]|nr:globin [Roseibacillus ishigakijimensis]
MDEEKIWQELGAEGFDRLTAAFYRRIRADRLIGPMYPDHDWEGSERRLALFLRFRFGQDPTYLQERGHPRLRMRHMPFRIGESERDRWLELMAGALEEENVAPDTAAAMMTFFAGVADFMRNR